MTYKVHGFLDNKKVINRRMDHIPRMGETVRLSDVQLAVVTEVIWCMDEDANPDWQRINLRMESIK